MLSRQPAHNICALVVELWLIGGVLLMLSCSVVFCNVYDEKRLLQSEEMHLKRVKAKKPWNEDVIRGDRSCQRETREANADPKTGGFIL